MTKKKQSTEAAVRESRRNGTRLELHWSSVSNMARTSDETIRLPDGGDMRAFLALPDGAPSEAGWPAMLAIHDIAGFCLGGGFAIFYAARGGVRVCAPYYGETPKTAGQLTHVCPVVAGFGELDRSFAEKGRRLESHLEELNVPHDVKIYPGVGHSYMNDHGAGPIVSAIVRASPLHGAYDDEAAEDSWKRMLEFFAKHL